MNPEEERNERAERSWRALHAAWWRIILEAHGIWRHASVAEGDKVAIRNVWSGAHQGVFQGALPTGRRVPFTGSATFRLVGGKIAEQWADLDALGPMRQLGAIPAAS